MIFDLCVTWYPELHKSHSFSMLIIRWSNTAVRVRFQVLELVMASNIDWALVLRDRFATFKVEENAFVESLKICNSTEVAIERIYEAIKEDDAVPRNLKLMYREAIFGDNEKVKGRIRNRISNIRRHLK